MRWCRKKSILWMDLWSCGPAKGVKRSIFIDLKVCDFLVLLTSMY